jgi:hypothetical protein
MRSGERYQGLEVCLIDAEGRADLGNIRVLCERCRGNQAKPDKIVPETNRLRDETVWRALEISGYRCQVCGGPVFRREEGSSP